MSGEIVLWKNTETIVDYTNVYDFIGKIKSKSWQLGLINWVKENNNW